MGDIIHLLRAVWNKACAFDGYANNVPNGRNFSRKNPWVPRYNRFLSHHRVVQARVEAALSNRRSRPVIRPAPDTWR